MSLKWPQLLFYASCIYHYVYTQSHFTMKTQRNCETKCKHLLHHFPKPRDTIEQHMLTRCFSLLIDNHSQTRLLEAFLFLTVHSSDWLSLYSLFSDFFLYIGYLYFSWSRVIPAHFASPLFCAGVHHLHWLDTQTCYFIHMRLSKILKVIQEFLVFFFFFLHFTKFVKQVLKYEHFKTSPFNDIQGTISLSIFFNSAS